LLKGAWVQNVGFSDAVGQPAFRKSGSSNGNDRNFTAGMEEPDDGRVPPKVCFTFVVASFTHDRVSNGGGKASSNFAPDSTAAISCATMATHFTELRGSTQTERQRMASGLSHLVPQESIAAAQLLRRFTFRIEGSYVYIVPVGTRTNQSG
jgi:hypothetical protein